MARASSAETPSPRDARAGRGRGAFADDDAARRASAAARDAKSDDDYDDAIADGATRIRDDDDGDDDDARRDGERGRGSSRRPARAGGRNDGADARAAAPAATARAARRRAERGMGRARRESNDERRARAKGFIFFYSNFSDVASDRWQTRRRRRQSSNFLGLLARVLFLSPVAVITVPVAAAPVDEICFPRAGNHGTSRLVVF